MNDEDCDKLIHVAQKWLHNLVHIGLVFASVYISQHPEYAPYSIVLQAWGQLMQGPK